MCASLQSSAHLHFAPSLQEALPTLQLTEIPIQHAKSLRSTDTDMGTTQWHKQFLEKL